MQLGEFAELAIQVGQAGEVQAIFQGKDWMDLCWATGWLFRSRLRATRSFPLAGEGAESTNSPSMFRYLRTPGPNGTE